MISLILELFQLLPIIPVFGHPNNVVYEIYSIDITQFNKKIFFSFHLR